MNSVRSAAFDDLELLLSIRRNVSLVGAVAAPRAEIIHRAVGSAVPGRRLAVLAGSFNPLTVAHEAILDQAMKTGQFDEASVAIAVNTIDKPEPEGAGLVDRLASLVDLARAHKTISVTVTNRGLYLDQATAFRQAFPDLVELTFLVGFDKILQILDPRYYQDRDKDLFQLFQSANFLVLPRHDHDRSALETLVSSPSNRLFGGMIGWLPLPDRYTHLSSSAIREVANPVADQLGASSHAGPAIAAGAYSSDQLGELRYRARQALINAIALMPSDLCRRIDFRKLMGSLMDGDTRIQAIIDQLKSRGPVTNLEESLTRAGFLT